ncbi:MAG: type II CAAX endopeptidase family protein [Bacteroidales bacterium]|jgi:membrane protease YdiL (CAAX protease family)|nr:type II CAAX endopeptidase family protein [Bacteroidales bacterium]
MNVIRKKPALIYLIFTFILTWTGGTIYFNETINETLPRRLTVVLRILFIPSLVAPFFMAGVMEYIRHRRKGVARLFRRFLPRNTNITWYILAIAIPMLVYGLASIADTFRGTPFLTPFANAGPQTPWIALQTFLLAGVAEEMGWRGYLQQQLQSTCKAWLISIIIGVVVAFWHLPLFFSPENIHANHPFLSFLGLMIAVSFLYTWLMDNTRSVLIAALFHTSHDMASMHFSQADYLSATLIYGLIALVILRVYGVSRFTKHPGQYPLYS